jgi:serine/threonine protein kinase
VTSSALPPPTRATSSSSADDERYRLLRRIGAGGMAEVFLARQRLGTGLSERTVVVKRILPHLADDAKFVRLFVREARLASQLQHPNIVQLHDVATLSGRAAIIMEHLRGIDARAAFRHATNRGRPLDPATAVAIAEQVALGLDHAHHALDDDGRALGIVHRDVSPHNVFLTRSGLVKILDFGVARSALEETATSSVKGKLAYMAPEQAFRKPLDQRTDLFALGVVLWELLTGRRLFRGGSPAETLQALLQAPIRPPSALVDTPPELDAIVLRMLAREPAQRYARGNDVAAALARARADLTDETGSALVARLVEDVSPQENTPTTPADPDSDVRDELLALDIAVGASARIEAAALHGAVSDEDESEDDALADPAPEPAPAAPTTRTAPPTVAWPWLVAGLAVLGAIGLALGNVLFAAPAEAPEGTTLTATAPPSTMAPAVTTTDTSDDDDTTADDTPADDRRVDDTSVDPSPMDTDPDAGPSPRSRRVTEAPTRPSRRRGLDGIDRDYP